MSKHVKNPLLGCGCIESKYSKGMPPESLSTEVTHIYFQTLALRHATYTHFQESQILTMWGVLQLLQIAICVQSKDKWNPLRIKNHWKRTEGCHVQAISKDPSVSKTFPFSPPHAISNSQDTEQSGSILTSSPAFGEAAIKTENVGWRISWPSNKNQVHGAFMKSIAAQSGRHD